MINIENLKNQATETVSYKKGDIIISDGDAGSVMYILVSGTVDVYKNYNQANQVRLVSLSKGAFFGEMSLFMNKRRTATVVAAEDIEALVIDHERALEFFKSQPEATFELIRSLCVRLGETNVSMVDKSIKHREKETRLTSEKEAFKTAANTDALTGLYNRRYFLETATPIIRKSFGRGGKIYVSIIDLDFFKKINDTYSHQAGDETLRAAARAITNTLRDDDLFARYGGEEFVMLLTRITREDAEMLAERLRRAIEETVVDYESVKINVTASFGISEVTSIDGIEPAIARADEALYKAKALGRNRYIFAQ